MSDALIGSSRDNIIDLDAENRTSKDEDRAKHWSNSGFVWLMIFGFFLSVLLGVGIVIVPQYRGPIQKRIDRLIDMRRANM